MQDLRPHSRGQVPPPGTAHLHAALSFVGALPVGARQSDALSSLLRHLQREGHTPKHSRRSPTQTTLARCRTSLLVCLLFPPSALGGSERVPPGCAPVVFR